MQPHPLEDILTRLDSMVTTARDKKDRAGYFAALYKLVAEHIDGKIDTFEHPDQMVTLDRQLARRYFEAWEAAHSGVNPPSQPWHVAFQAAQQIDVCVLQHLLLGINAHIRFDLCVAASNELTIEQIQQQAGDYRQTAAILFDTVHSLEGKAPDIWHLGVLKFWNWLLRPVEDGIIRFALWQALNAAHAKAIELERSDETQRKLKLLELEKKVAASAEDIYHPRFPYTLFFNLVRAGERHSMRETIDILTRKFRLGGPQTGGNREARRPRKIAILGGGVAAITAAFELTDPHNPKHKAEPYDVTVYQLGWRLGGKCASGRSLDDAHYSRIEEHGLHLWFGSYGNSFRLIQDCYKELKRPKHAPLATWQQAFTGNKSTVLMEYVNGHWTSWRTDSKTSRDNPATQASEGRKDRVYAFTSWVIGLIPRPGRDLEATLASWAMPSTSWLLTGFVLWLIGFFYWLHIRWEPCRLVELGAVKLARACMIQLWKYVRPHCNTRDRLRRLWVLMNFGFACFRGGVEEDIVSKGLDQLNDYEFREWLRKYAIHDGGAMLNSAWMLGLYDACFAYENGDNGWPQGAEFPPKASMAAGTALRIGLRQLLTSKGAKAFRMNAGTGDTLFAPLYQVLRRRGVKFKFFHRVTHLHPSSDGKFIDRIDIKRQVDITPAREAHGGYTPLIPVNGLPCWPSKPRFKQIVQGDQLQAAGIDLEEFCSEWNDVGDVCLKRGEQFDDVVLGISLGALPFICSDLINRSQKWKQMVQHVKTARTMGVQLWLEPKIGELGWTTAMDPIVGAFDATPLNTWCDMTHLLEREGWSALPRPGSLAYFCGPMCEDAIPPHAPGEQQRADRTVTQVTSDLLNKMLVNGVIPIEVLWPKSIERAGTKKTKQFKWHWLVDHGANPATGTGRLKSQWVHANVAPSERYVLSLPGSDRYRLPAHDEEEFTNLYLAGDWTNNRMNIGCVEAATMSGMLASYELSDYPPLEQIEGLPRGWNTSEDLRYKFNGTPVSAQKTGR